MARSVSSLGYRDLLRALLLFIALSGPRVGGEPRIDEPAPSWQGILIHLRFGAERAVFLVNEARETIGLPVARRFFQAAFPGATPGSQPAYERKWTWRVILVLEDELLRRKLLALLEAFGRKRLHIGVVLDDSPDRLYPGEDIIVPATPGSRGARLLLHRVASKQPLSTVATRFATSTERLLAENSNRFVVFPATTEGNAATGPMVWMGERGLEKACRDEADLREMLLHEVGHVVETASCPGHDDLMGHRHGARDVSNGPMAFREGWATYCAGVVPGTHQKWKESVPEWLWSPVRPGQAKRDRLEGASLKLPHFLAHEITVANLLMDLAALPSGRTGLLQALKAAWGRPCPGLPDLFVEYLRRFPENRSAVESALRRRTRNTGSNEQYAACLEGRSIAGAESFR